MDRVTCSHVHMYVCACVINYYIFLLIPTDVTA